ncbi:hypothetical protein SELMODRAFT_169299 [Selaginella moellendorffii]|uniref:DYW domain-containing protein n=1 Tax=Selaginella moellendorffii TaxID=88036 RepID=D8R9Y7_SELML|nr:hypothetical protein SELMODRAFT_169299 [Selaginella moellendorffii]
MEAREIQAEISACAAILTACSDLRALPEGKRVHGLVMRESLLQDERPDESLLENIVIQMYLRCGCTDLALDVFDRMKDQNVVAWTSLISAFTFAGHFGDAMVLFRKMLLSGVSPDRITFTSILLKWSGRERNLDEGKRVHSHIMQTGYEGDRMVMNLVVEMYGKCGDVEQAGNVFDSIQDPNVFSWTIIIAAYAQNGHCMEVLRLLSRMNQAGVKPDGYTFTTVLGACTAVGALEEAKILHAATISSTGLDRDAAVGTALINLYGKCGALEEAFGVFVQIDNKDIVSWSSMIAAFAQSGQAKSAIQLLMLMDLEGVRPNNVTFVNVLEAVTSLKAFQYGKEIHARIVQAGYSDDVCLTSALVKMYCNWGWVETARSIFESSRERDVVSWSSMIAGYSQNESPARALSLFREMEVDGVQPNSVTFVSAIDACAGVGALRRGTQLHERVRCLGLDKDVPVATALVNLYGKCGRLEEAEAVFLGMKKKNLLTWTSIAMAYGQNGHGSRSLKLLHGMELQGMKPDGIVFVAILVSCNYAGQMSKGLHYYNLMTQDFGIAPAVEHCGCMVDILGRAGKLEAAEQLINTMKFESSLAWMMLLTACKAHNDTARAARAAEKIFQLEPKNATPYVLLSSVFCAAGSWEAAEETRRRMDGRGVQRLLGRSSIEIGDRVHEFVAASDVLPHHLVGEIFAALEKLGREMQGAGYVPDATAVRLRDVEEGGKENAVPYHSEMLALGLGIISTPAGTPLRITKNLRMCSDCHIATKFVSKLVHRRISVRDGRRHHHFENGVCSCGDYW